MQELEYEWVGGIQCQNRINQFLNEIDDIMIPHLSDRVDIPEYACKLACLAETLFIVHRGYDIASCSVYCNSKIAFISSIAVQKAFLKQGIGTCLMNEVKRHAGEKGCESIQLEVYSENDNAFNFYVKNGFVITAEKNKFKRMEYFYT